MEILKAVKLELGWLLINCTVTGEKGQLNFRVDVFLDVFLDIEWMAMW